MAIEWFDTGRPESTVVGGKGASLIEMHRAGFPVPPGFCITADAYQRFSDEAGLHRHIAALSTVADLATVQGAAEAVAPLLDRLRHATIPLPDRREIEDAYHALCDMTADRSLVAARSSSASEDGARASSAGIYDTYLNLADGPQLLNAVLDCYRALWTPRAVQYRATHGLGQTTEQMAVVVMQMVQATVAGVAFTMNPLTGNRDEVLINASWGLGEAVVGGRVTPDNVIANKANGSVSSYDVGDKAIEIVLDAPSGRGAIERSVDPERAQQRCLTDANVRSIVDLAQRAEQHFAFPQDIEFAFAGAQWYILQARPITGHR